MQLIPFFARRLLRKYVFKKRVEPSTIEEKRFMYSIGYLIVASYGAGVFGYLAFKRQDKLIVPRNLRMPQDPNIAERPRPIVAVSMGKYFPKLDVIEPEKREEFLREKGIN